MRAKICRSAGHLTKKRFKVVKSYIKMSMFFPNLVLRVHATVIPYTYTL